MLWLAPPACWHFLRAEIIWFAYNTRYIEGIFCWRNPLLLKYFVHTFMSRYLMFLFFLMLALKSFDDSSLTAVGIYHESEWGWNTCTAVLAYFFLQVAYFEPLLVLRGEGAVTAESTFGGGKSWQLCTQRETPPPLCTLHSAQWIVHIAQCTFHSAQGDSPTPV